MSTLKQFLEKNILEFFVAGVGWNQKRHQDDFQGVLSFMYGCSGRARHQSVGPVCFVGDGINDSPVLANSEIGIAMDTGTDNAVESADIVLMSSRIDNVSHAIRISRATMSNNRQNLVWAFA